MLSLHKEHLFIGVDDKWLGLTLVTVRCVASLSHPQEPNKTPHLPIRTVTLSRLHRLYPDATPSYVLVAGSNDLRDCTVKQAP